MGLLDNLNMNLDPKTQGLLGLGQGLLQSSGWSPTPISTGQAMGQGLQSGLGAYTQAQDRLAKQNKGQKPFSVGKGASVYDPNTGKFIQSPGVAGGVDGYSIVEKDGVSYQQSPEGKLSAIPGLETPTDIKTRKFAEAEKLRNKFITESKTFVDSRDAYSRVLAAGEDPSPAGDMALIFNYMKVLDPGSTVREGEFAQAAASGALGERVKAAVGRVISGNRLTSGMRRDFMDRSYKLYSKQRENHEQSRDQYGKLAESYELMPERVVMDYMRGYGPPDLPPLEGQTQEPTVPGQTAIPGADNVINVGGRRLRINK